MKALAGLALLGGAVALGRLPPRMVNRVRIFHRAMDEGDCRKAEAVLEEMNREEIVRVLQSMVSHFNRGCGG